MPAYINNGTKTIYLIGPDGVRVAMAPGNPMELPDFFDMHVRRNKISRVNGTPPKPKASIMAIQPKRQNQPVAPVKTTVIKPVRHTPAKTQVIRENTQARQQPSRIRSLAINKPEPRSARLSDIVVRRAQIRPPRQKEIVGKSMSVNATNHLNSVIASNRYPISNGVGVGILSYNRPGSLKRLIASIRKHTKLNNTTIFISDDCSSNQELAEYLNELAGDADFAIMTSDTRLGIAGNSNKLLQCLQRFEYGLLLNDDVEILSDGWDIFYRDASKASGIQHFCYREPGVYGAQIGKACKINDVNMTVVHDKPHGAVLAFTGAAFNKVGYFDESFGIYGFEHVDWSFRLQNTNSAPGYFDVVTSNSYFKIHKEESAVDNRQEHYAKARVRWESIKDNRPSFIDCPNKMVGVSYVIPYRDVGRSDSVSDIIDNIRAQRFPVIEIIVTEHDSVRRCPPIYAKHILDTHGGTGPFNKARAFNCGVFAALYDKIVLHDADMLVPGSYTKIIDNLLKRYEACHIGKTVTYLDQEPTEQVHRSKTVLPNMGAGRVVGYYEGGTLACLKSAYVSVGGFNEAFVGYGVEDCEFYDRLSQNTNWYGERTENLIHLWHPRSTEWNACHIKNTQLYNEMRKKSVSERIAALKLRLSEIGFTI